MKSRLVLALAFSAVLIFAAAGWAEYGTWTTLSALPGTPGLSNAGFLGLGIGDINNLYTVGIQQTSSSGMENGWKSTDGGTQWNPIRGADITNMNSCDVLAFFDIATTVATTGPDNVQYFGIGPDPSCAAQHPFPQCMFICMFQMVPTIAYSNDGGNTFNNGTVSPAALFDDYTSVHFVNQTIGYMSGAPDLIARTQDGGQTWVKINAPGDSSTALNGIDFVDADNGFVVSGAGAADDDSSGEKLDANDPATAIKQWEAVRNHALWLKDPAYRLAHQGEIRNSGKGTDGNIWRTSNGGQTWDLVFTQAEQSFDSIQIVDDKHIWVMGEPNVANEFGVTLWRSADGGDTWVDYTSRLPTPHLQYAAFISAMQFSPDGMTGFLGGAMGVSSFVKGSPIIYTIDRGETWTFDATSTNALLHGIMGMAFGDEKHAWGVGMDLAAYGYVQLHAAPVADAGPDQTVPSGTLVTLDGSGSYSPETPPLPLTYAWTKTAGGAVDLSDPTAVKPTFVAGAVGAYTFQLTVNDGQESSSDDVVITVTENTDDDASPSDDDASPSDDDASPTDDDAADDDASPAGPSSNSKSNSGCGC